MIEAFTGILNKEFLGNQLWQFGLWILIIIFSVIIGQIFRYIIKNFVLSITRKTKTKLDDLIIESIGGPLVFFIFTLGFYLGFLTLKLNEKLSKFISDVSGILVIIGFSWLIIKLLDNLVTFYVIPFTKKTESDLDDQLIPVLRKLIKIIVVLIAALMIIDKFGYNINSILAGVGIGGLAFAFAAKDLLANFFGGVAVFTERPFKIGDRIKVAGHDGWVQEIGLRTTKIKTLENRILIVPNAKFTEDVIENITQEPARKIKFSIGITYNTPPAKMEKAVKIIKEVIDKHKKTNENSTVYFDSYGDFSLNIEVIYYIDHKNSWETVYTTKHAINMEILERFNKEKISFAFPTQTIELHRSK